jgi:1-acyl-sn-glycerol-3-phosphate acyltransferase
MSLHGAFQGISEEARKPCASASSPRGHPRCTTDPRMQELGHNREPGDGYDLFGMHVPSVQRAVRWGRPVYQRYFRVQSHGIDRVPTDGPAILAANHSGALPIDGAMLWLDVVQHTGRILRTIADRFVPLLPFVSTVFARTGVVSGTHTNVRRLLENGELIAIFPEGTEGTGKAFRDRYHLQTWRVGHAEAAIRYRAPVVPVAIIGAEESWPVLFKLRTFHLFGAPYVPVPASLLPLPVQFHIHYGEPIALHREYPPYAADDPDVVGAAARKVRDAVAALVERGLAGRRAS